MAGGRGLRLDPLTRHQPKPMLHVTGKPIIETLVNSLVDQGIREITMALCYKAALIRNYFGNGVDRGCRIRYLIETDPLGTAGALKMVRSVAPITDPIIVFNADVITHLNLDDLLRYHAEAGAMATMCVTPYQHQIPYGVVHHKKWMVQHIDEKPIRDDLVVAGIYVLAPEAFDHLPEEDRFDMPDFLMNMPSCAAYLLPEFWLDVGTYESYEEANA